MDSQKNTIRGKHWLPFKQDLIPNKLSKALANGLIHAQKKGECSKSILKFSRHSKQRNPNNCDRALQRHAPQLASQAIMM